MSDDTNNEKSEREPVSVDTKTLTKIDNIVRRNY